MKFLALAVCATGLAFAQNWPVRPANLTIRFAPATELMSGVPIPFKIQVTDPLHKPVVQAKVTLEIHRPDRTKTAVFKAPAIDRGVYMAKPVFPSPGTWEVYVEVRWEDQHGGRTIKYNVPRSAAP
ncbi:MAG: FixH family protein [Rhodanobacteraceae bacterium]